MNEIIKFLMELDESASRARGDIISLIKADHRKVDMLFAEYATSEKVANKRALLKKIVEELNVHSAAEEKLVYPNLKDADAAGTNEAFEEHHVIEGVLKELMDIEDIDELVDAKTKVLAELVKHHVKEEERKLLPEIKSTGVDLMTLGEKFQLEKNRLKEKSPRPGQANVNAKAFKRKAS